MIEGSFTDFTALYIVLKLKKMVSGFLEQKDVVITLIYIGVFIKRKQIPIKFSEAF